MTLETEIRMNLLELNERSNDGIFVSLLYDPAANQTFIELLDQSGLQIFPVPRNKAKEAFEHPYTYVTTTVEVL